MTSLFDKHSTDIHVILNKRCCCFPNSVPEAQDPGNFLYALISCTADWPVCHWLSFFFFFLVPLINWKGFEAIWEGGSPLNPLFFSWDNFAEGALRESQEFC